MLDTLITIGSTIFVLGVLIYIHELGHFLIAKRVGIKVERFSLGFPPYIFQYQKGETTYSVGLIPLGGFVKMAGENPEEESKGDPREFMSKSVGQRAAVIFAGPFMNYVFAIFLSIVALMLFGQPITDDNKIIVGQVTANSPAEQAGLRSGDEIIKVNDKIVSSFDSMAAIIHPIIEENVTLTWIHENDTLTRSITTMKSFLPNEQGGKDTVGLVGISPGVRFESVGFTESITKGTVLAHRAVKLTVQFVWLYISGQVAADSIGGPVFIAQQSGQVAKQGPFWLFSFMALLSVNLAVLNVLPIPVLDGGQLVFLLIEKIKGSPLSIKARGMAQQIGILFLLVVILMVTYNDIMRFITG